LGSTGGLGSLPPGVSATPLHPGDAVGYLTVPVEIGKDGTITPLLHTNAPAAPAVPSTPAVPHPTPIHHAPPVHAVPHHPVHAVPHHPVHPAGHHVGTNESGALGSGGGSGGGSLGGGGLTSSSGAQPHRADAQFVSSTPATIGAHPATAGAAAAHGTAPAGGASHDGLYGGIGQATGIGAGAAALARATLHEARQRAENGLLGAVTLPFDADADTAVRATVLNGELQ